MFKKNLLIALLLIGAVAPISQVAAASCSSSCNTTCATTSCSSNCFTSNSCSSSCSTGSCCGCPCAGKTFFTNRPLYQTARPEYVSGFLNDKMVAAADGIGGSFEAVLFGGKATKTRNLASYFMPNCKTVLNVNEASSSTAPADLLATNFGIYTVNGTTGGTGFQSNICFNARASEFGLGLHYLQGFCFNDDRSAWWYLDISTPITHVNSELLLTESIVTTGGGADEFASTNTVVSNMTEAFNQSSWCFGKIASCEKHGKTRLADIEVKLGYEWMYSDRAMFASYVGFVAPTGNKAKAEYVFEPIVGNGKHWGVMLGSQGEFDVWDSCNDKYHLAFSFYTNAEYLFQNKQMRSFDLKGKPWSRYISVYANEAAAAAAALLPGVPGAHLTPGINVFTQHVKVQPRFQYNLTTMWTLSSDCGFQGELGYNLYAREKECVKLDCPWVTGPAIADGAGAGETNPVRNITGNEFLNGITAVPLASYTQSLILASDLDLDSAAHPAMLSNTVYGSLGYKWADMCTPLHMNIGGSYEWAGKDFAVMNRWTLWGKFGVSF